MKTPTRGWLLRKLHAARVRRQAVASYAPLLAAPQAGGPLALPASGVFALVAAAGSVATASALDIVGPQSRTVGTPALDAGERHVVGYLERGTVCELAAAFDLHLDTGLGAWRPVLTGA